MFLKTNQEIINDDLSILKKEKQNLIQEKTLLKAKILRFTNKNKQFKKPLPKLGIQNSLEKELTQIEQLMAEKRAEIALIKRSDISAHVQELQEECILLYMEIKRLELEKDESEKKKKKNL